MKQMQPHLHHLDLVQLLMMKLGKIHVLSFSSIPYEAFPTSTAVLGKLMVPWLARANTWPRQIAPLNGITKQIMPNGPYAHARLTYT
jgi:hypothetical protein